MKTIFIPIFQGHQSRNILRTEVFDLLKKHTDLRLVIFTKKIKEGYYRKQFSDERVFIEGIDLPEPSWLEKKFQNLVLIAIDTKTVKLRQLRVFYETKNFISYGIKRLFSKIFGNFFYLQRLLRFIDYRFFYIKYLEEYFIKYAPSAIFSPHIMSRFDTLFIKTAKRFGVTSISLVNSWDNLSSRGMIRIFPDYLLVHNNTLKQEAISYDGYPPDKITVIGMPHFDYYINGQRSPKEVFYKKIGVSLDKEILLFCPAGYRTNKTEWRTVKFIDDAIRSGRIKFPAHILVRQAPNANMIMGELRESENITFDKTSKKFESSDPNDWEWTKDDMNHLADSIYYSKMLIGYASTMIIDAAAFDKPIININFEIIKPKEWHESYFWFYYHTTHYDLLHNTNGIKLVNNENDLIDAINGYYANSGLDHDGRLRMVSEQCWKLDGKSCLRLVDAIINLIYV